MDDKIKSSELKTSNSLKSEIKCFAKLLENESKSAKDKIKIKIDPGNINMNMPGSNSYNNSNASASKNKYNNFFNYSKNPVSLASNSQIKTDNNYVKYNNGGDNGKFTILYLLLIN